MADRVPQRRNGKLEEETLPKSQIPSLYSKLTTINFELIQNLQKEVENKNNLIEKSFT